MGKLDGMQRGYLSKEVFAGAGGVVQPLNQQRTELLNGQAQTFDLIGPAAHVAFRTITWAGVQRVV